MVVNTNSIKGDIDMKIRVGIDIACRSPHVAAIADEAGNILSRRHRFRTVVSELDAFWAQVPADATEVLVVMEPTRNAWVPLAAWFRRRGAMVVIVPSEQSADLRDYMSKHTKTDRLDAELLARLPVLHPEGLHPAEDLGPGDPLKRAVKIRAGLVHRRTAAMHRLDSLLEILGPGWTDTLGTRMTQTTFKFLTLYANPHQVKRLGATRLARWFQHHTRKAWGPERAQQMIDAAERDDRIVGQRRPRLRRARCRHCHRGHPRARGVRTDRPPGPADQGSLRRGRPDRDRAVGPRGRRHPRRTDHGPTR